MQPVEKYTLKNSQRKTTPRYAQTEHTIETLVQRIERLIHYLSAAERSCEQKESKKINE